MALKLFKPKKYTKFEEYIAFNKSGMYFSAGFVKAQSLDKSQFIRFYIDDEDEYKFAVSFSEEEEEDSLALTRTRGARSNPANSFYVNAAKIRNTIPSIKKFYKSYLGTSNSEHKLDNKFQLKFDRASSEQVDKKVFVFYLLPTFEKECEPAFIPEGSGIYRYLNENNSVIYIGRGNLKQRFSEFGREDWGIKKVEYSLVDDKERQEELETYYLDLFEKRHGVLPRENKVRGTGSRNF